MPSTIDVDLVTMGSSRAKSNEFQDTGAKLKAMIGNKPWPSAKVFITLLLMFAKVSLILNGDHFKFQANAQLQASPSCQAYFGGTVHSCHHHKTSRYS